MLSVITFKYSKPGYRTTYESRHVNALRDMVAKHYPKPHRFFCVTDDRTGLASGIEYVPMWRDHFHLVNPSHPTSRPNCYPRLKLFAPEMRDLFGERFVSLDLDIAIVGNLEPLWDRPEDFIIYDARGDDHYNGSMFIQNAGCRAQVWRNFDPVQSPKVTTAAGMRGSDQAWIRYCLSPSAATWTNADGVHAYLHFCPARKDRPRRRMTATHVIRRGNPHKIKAPPPRYPMDGSLPPGARMVIFAGEYKPWEPRTQQMSPWLKQHYPFVG